MNNRNSIQASNYFAEKGEISMPDEKMLNGVSVSAVESMVNDFNETPELAKSKFRAKNEWIDGGHNRTTVRLLQCWPGNLTYQTICLGGR
jgi:hypothetical protein